MLKDFSPPSSLGWAVSTLTTFTALLPAISPFLGGLVLIAFNLRSIMCPRVSPYQLHAFLRQRCISSQHRANEEQSYIRFTYNPSSERGFQL